MKIPSIFTLNFKTIACVFQPPPPPIVYQPPPIYQRPPPPTRPCPPQKECPECPDKPCTTPR